MDVSSPYFRRLFAQAMAVEPALEDLRVLGLARALARLAPGRRVWLYGCGSLARRLAQEHRDLLARLAPRFITSTAEDSEFFGLPLSTPEEGLEAEGLPEWCVILSVANEEPMRARLKAVGLCPEAVSTLTQTLEDLADGQLFAEASGRLRALALEIAAELARRFGSEPPFAYFDLTWTDQPRFFRAIRGQGVPLAVFSWRNGNEDTIAHLERSGAVDFAQCRFFFAAFWLVSCHLAAAYRFRGVAAWLLEVQSGCLRHMAEHSLGPLVVWQDILIDQLRRDPVFPVEYARRFAVDFLGRDREIEGETYALADGVVYRYDEQTVADYLAAKGARCPAMQFFCPLDPETAEPPRDAPDCRGRLRLAIVSSVHTPWTAPWYASGELVLTEEALLPMVKELTSDPDVEVTLFNRIDTGHGEFARTEAEARSNPRFHYHPGMPRDLLIRELRSFDFGWMGYRFRMHPEHHRRHHLQFTLFTFMAAGIPTLASVEESHLSGLVQRLGVGACVDWSQWGNLSQALRGFDFPAFAQALLRARAALAPERCGRELGTFLKQFKGQRRASW